MGLTFTSEMCADEKKRLNNEETSPQSFAVGVVDLLTVTGSCYCFI